MTTVTRLIITFTYGVVVGLLVLNAAMHSWIMLGISCVSVTAASLMLGRVWWPGEVELVDVPYIIEVPAPSQPHDPRSNDYNMGYEDGKADTAAKFKGDFEFEI